MTYYLAALLGIIIVNYVVERFGTSTAKLATFLLTAGMPLILIGSVTVWLLATVGPSSLTGYFWGLWVSALGYSVVTAITAFLSKAVARWAMSRRGSGG